MDSDRSVSSSSVSSYSYYSDRQGYIRSPRQKFDAALSRLFHRVIQEKTRPRAAYADGFLCDDCAPRARVPPRLQYLLKIETRSMSEVRRANACSDSYFTHTFREQPRQSKVSRKERNHPILGQGEFVALGDSSEAVREAGD